MARAGPRSREPQPLRRGKPRRWPWVVAVALGVLAVVSVATLNAPRPQSSTKRVAAAPSEVILSASDIPDIGWGLRAAGSNGSGVWRLFSVHNELILAFLNVTLWVESGAVQTGQRASAVADSAGCALEDGAVPEADASWFWSCGSGPYAGMVVRRYNVVFRLDAYLESSFALTRSDLGTWAGWQLSKLEAFAA